MAAHRCPRTDAKAYLEKHNLFRLFEILGAKLAYLKPEDPNAFLVAELQKIDTMRANKQPVTLFNEQDLGAMFGVFDITGRGYLSRQQYLRALNAVGISEPTLAIPQSETIDKRTFVSHLHAEVMRNAFV